MTPEDLPELKEGDELSAGWLNTIRRALIDPAIDVDPESGLTATVDGRRTTIGISGPNQAYVVKTNGTITARSGATYGTGNAYIQTDTGSALANGPAVVVKNLIPAVIATGKYGIAWRVGGKYFLIAEC
jgi:hypothetical protein